MLIGQTLGLFKSATLNNTVESGGLLFMSDSSSTQTVICATSGYGCLVQTSHADIVLPVEMQHMLQALVVT